jgi:hypothetical protein
MTTLTKSDKIQLIDSRMRGLEYKKYGLELDLIVENAKAEPTQDSLTVINTTIEEIEDQITALNSELVVVNALTE